MNSEKKLSLSYLTERRKKVEEHDYRTGMAPELGFSIKSKLGGASTLLNAGRTTNFIYKVRNRNFSELEIQVINSMDTRSKIKDRIAEIQKLGGVMDFHSTESTVFGNNLILIDSALPKIVAEALLLYYCSNLNKTTELVGKIEKQNPLDFNLETSHPYYAYKLKRFLTDIALGMMPSKTWTGEIDSTGGYLVVKEDGDVLCYHIYNRNEFEDYLFVNTRFDTASSSRHGFGELYKQGEDFYFKLNLQIRFL